MPFTFNEDSEIYVDGERILFPRDANHSPSAFLSGLDTDDNIVLGSFTPDRRLRVDASVSIDTVDIGDVNMKIKLVGGGEAYVFGGLNPDTLSYFAYVQDQRMFFAGDRLKVDASITLSTDRVDDHDAVSGIAANTPTAVLTYIVPVGKTLYLQAARGSGYVPAEYWIEIDGTEREHQRSNWANWNVRFDFLQDGIIVASGDVVKVYVEHRFIATQDFNASIYGMLV
jgi:hypothetical protein